jgi:hypothetical protein
LLTSFRNGHVEKLNPLGALVPTRTLLIERSKLSQGQGKGAPASAVRL